MPKRIVAMRDCTVSAAVFGAKDENAKRIEDAFSVHLYNESDPSAEGELLAVTGEDARQVERAARAVEYLSRMVGLGDSLEEQTVDYVIAMIADGHGDELDGMDRSVLCVTNKGKPIRPKTAGQRQYVEAIRKNTITFGLGPAGTGKTFLAVAMAVDALRSKTVDRLIITRPAVEAGERLGFLPGDLQSKIDPYLRPLYDALFEMLGAENYARHHEKGTIEVAPLAYMRGRTLDHAYIILDEAQNTTSEQMKMFLTRLGHNSKMVVTGDPSQVDLPDGRKSGLAIAERILRGIPDIALHTFSERDVVRHRLVQSIIKAYEKYDALPGAGQRGRQYVAKKQGGK